MCPGLNEAITDRDYAASILIEGSQCWSLINDKWSTILEKYSGNYATKHETFKYALTLFESVK